MSANKRTVLILDQELGFAFWLGQALDQAGYDAFPARSCEDAIVLLNQLNASVDLLVVGYALAGALAFATALRRSQHQLKILLAIGNGDEPVLSFSDADATRYKPSSAETASKTEWLQTIEGLFATSASFM